MATASAQAIHRLIPVGSGNAERGFAAVDAASVGPVAALFDADAGAGSPTLSSQEFRVAPLSA
jgi:hypothetical protein